MRGSSSGAPKRRSAYERMRAALRDWDVLFAELGAQVAGGTTRIRSAYARTAVRFGSQRHQAERELAALRDASVEDRRRGTPELERTMAELRDIVATVRLPIEGP